MLKHSIAFAFLLVIAALIPACKKEEPSATPPPATATPAAPSVAAPSPAVVRPAEPPKAPDLTVSADAIADAYKADEHAADSKYRDKYIEVKGIVGNPGAPGVEKNYFVVSATANPAMFAFGPFFRCFVTDADSVRSITLGQSQKITFRGMCAGKTKESSSTLLDFTDCRIIKTGPDPAPPYTAEEIARAFSENEKAARDKYHWGVKGNKIIVSGTVQKLDLEKGEVWLDGFTTPAGKAIGVHCRIYPLFWPEAMNHAVGQPIKIKGECDDFKGDYELMMFGSVVAPASVNETPDPADALPVDVTPKLTLKTADKSVYAVCFGEGGKTVFAGTVNGPVLAWDAVSGTSKGATTGDDSYVNLQLSPDQKTIAASGQFDTIKLLDATTGKELRSLAGHTGRGGSLLGIEALAWSPDGTRLASAKGLEIKIWDVASSKEIVTFNAPDKISNVRCLAFSADGQKLTGGGDAGGLTMEGTLFIWDTSGKLNATVPMPGGSVHWALFLDDQTLIAPTNFTGAATIDIATGKPVRRFNTDFDTLVSGAISPDHKHLLTGDVSKGIVQYWDISTGNVVANFKGHSGEVNKVAFSPDGKWAVTGSNDQSVCIWQVPP